MFVDLYFALFRLQSLALESFTLFNIIYMTNNLNWFESPVPKPSNYNSLPLFRTDNEAENEDHQWRTITFFSPEPVPSGYKSHHGNSESPWSNLLNEGFGNREHELSIPGFLPAEQHKQSYDRQLVFSEEDDNEEEEELITPIRQDVSVKEDHSEGELHTTGKKSQGEVACSAKKSRPREKGLRKLSQRAYEIVQEMRNVTYKEVAAKLVQQLNEDEFQSQNKEQQNIKRRVYDALNVLIALGVLRKDGRKIVSDRASKQARSRYSHDKELQSLKQKVVSKSQAVEEKLKEFKLAVQKRKEVAFLLERNKNSCYFSEYKITFPFIGVCCNAQEVERLSWPRADFVLLRSKSALQPFGDMDSLKFFKSAETDQGDETSQF